MSPGVPPVAGAEERLLEIQRQGGPRGVLSIEFEDAHKREQAGQQGDPAEREPFLPWAREIPEPKAGRLSWERFPFQPAIYKAFGSDAREACCLKAVQVGMSALVVRYALWRAEQWGDTVLYFFPTYGDVLDFSDARVTPMIYGSSYLQGRIGRIDSKGAKVLGAGRILFRGFASKSGLQAIDADALIFDEYDLLDPANIPDAEQRQAGSTKPHTRRIGVPSVPGVGMDRLYQESQKSTWQVKCLKPGCKAGWQEIKFKDNVYTPEGKAPYIGCYLCASRLRVARGQWVAEYPDRPNPGFHVSRLIVPEARLVDIVKASAAREEYAVQIFWNKFLGLPYASAEGSLTTDAIAAAMREFALEAAYLGDNLVTLGCDVASVRNLNVRISEHLPDGTKRALWIGEVTSFDDLDGLMTRYKVGMAVVDHLPENRLARAFANRHPGRVFLCSLTGGAQKDVLVPDWEQGRVSVRRTEAIDAVIEAIRAQRNLLPVNPPRGYGDQLQAPKRRVEKDEFGRMVVHYISTGPDDYMMCEAFDMVAEELWYLRQHVDTAAAGVFAPLDELLEFQRSDVADPGTMDYRPGLDEEYRP